MRKGGKKLGRSELRVGVSVENWAIRIHISSVLRPQQSSHSASIFGYYSKSTLFSLKRQYVLCGRTRRAVEICSRYADAARLFVISKREIWYVLINRNYHQIYFFIHERLSRSCNIRYKQNGTTHISILISHILLISQLYRNIFKSFFNKSSRKNVCISLNKNYEWMEATLGCGPYYKHLLATTIAPWRRKGCACSNPMPFNGILCTDIALCQSSLFPRLFKTIRDLILDSSLSLDSRKTYILHKRIVKIIELIF